MNYPILKIERLDYQTPLTDIYLFERVFVYSSKGLFGLIADNFGSIIPPIYEEIFPAFDFHFWGRKNHKWKLYNFQNNVINNTPFKAASPFINGYSCASIDGRTFGFINRKGDFIISPNYFGGQHLGNLIFAVKIKESKKKHRIIDRHENFILSFEFNEIPTFTDVVVLILKSRKPLREWLKL